MRQILIYILVQRPFAFWERDPRTGVPGVGLTWVLLASTRRPKAIEAP